VSERGQGLAGGSSLLRERRARCYRERGAWGEGDDHMCIVSECLFPSSLAQGDRQRLEQEEDRNGWLAIALQWCSLARAGRREKLLFCLCSSSSSGGGRASNLHSHREIPFFAVVHRHRRPRTPDDNKSKKQTLLAFGRIIIYINPLSLPLSTDVLCATNAPCSYQET